MRTPGIATLAVLALAGPLWAGHIYSYHFKSGEDLTYTLTVQSRAQIVLPDGAIRNSKLSSTTTYVQSAVGQAGADGTLSVATRVLSTKGELDGKPAPEMKGKGEPHVIKVRATGEAVSAEGTARAASLPVVFPGKSLEFQDKFEQVGAVSGGDSDLTFKTIYTLEQVGATLLNYDRPVSVFKAVLEVASPGKTKDGAPRAIKLRKGEGTMWFDEQAGRLVRSKLTWVYDEEVPRAGAKPSRRTVAMATELALGAP